MNILAGNSEMYAWTEALFADVHEDIKGRWDIVRAPVSTDVGAIQIKLRNYHPSIDVVGTHVDTKVNFKEGAVEIKTLYKKKTLIFSATMTVGSIEITSNDLSSQKN